MPGKGSPEFIDIMNKCIEIHYKKNHDYANESNPLLNFDRQREIVSWFSRPIDQAFASVIAIKIARLSELLSSAAKPNNESCDDNFMDLINYCGLWAAWHKKNRLTPTQEYNKKIEERQNIICNKCSRMFTDIMAIRTKYGNFCSNRCADEYEEQNATKNNSSRT